MESAVTAVCDARGCLVKLEFIWRQQCCPLGIHTHEPYDDVSLLTKVLEILLRKPHEMSIFLSKDIHQHIVLKYFK